MTDLIRVQDPVTGEVSVLDEYNMTVTLANGRKIDMRPVDGIDGLEGRADQLGLTDVHQDSILNNFITGYGLQSTKAIADIVAPPLLVNKASDKYYTVSENDTFRRPDALVADESSPIKEIAPTLSTDTYDTVAYGLSAFVSQGVEANADGPVRPRLRALTRIMNAMVTEREHRAASALLNGTTFSGYSTTLTTSNYWDDGTSSDPVKDIMTAQESMLGDLTHIAMSRKSWNRFVKNANTAKYGLYTSTALSPSMNEIAERLGFPGVVFVVGDMKSESLTAGTTTKSYVWDDDVIFLSIPPDAGSNGESIPTCRTFRWLKDGMSRETGGFRVREWDEPNRGQDGGRKIAVVCNEVVKVVAANTGYFLENVW